MEYITTLLAMRDEINELNNKIQNNNKENNDNDNMDTSDDSPPPPTESINDTLPIYYSMNGGRVGLNDLNNTLLGSMSWTCPLDSHLSSL